MTEDQFQAVVDQELAKYLDEIRAAGEPYTPNEAAWQQHAAVIAAAAVAVYYAQGAPPPAPYGADAAATLATEIAASNTVAGVATSVDVKIAASLAISAAATAALLASTAPWTALVSAVTANVFLWAAAAGALAAAIAAGYTHKAWAARNDDKTRPDHRAANGQTVPIGAVFTVGGWAMRYPHDPLAPPEETARCRCKLKFSRR